MINIVHIFKTSKHFLFFTNVYNIFYFLYAYNISLHCKYNIKLYTYNDPFKYLILSCSLGAQLYFFFFFPLFFNDH